MGDGRQVAALVRAGIHGDAVLLPEYVAAPLPLSGRGAAIIDIVLRRPGEPIHEALRTDELPDVVAAGAELVLELTELGYRLSAASGAPRAESDSLFVTATATRSTPASPRSPTVPRPPAPTPPTSKCRSPSCCA